MAESDANELEERVANLNLRPGEEQAAPPPRDLQRAGQRAEPKRRDVATAATPAEAGAATAANRAGPAGPLARSPATAPPLHEEVDMRVYYQSAFKNARNHMEHANGSIKLTGLHWGLRDLCKGNDLSPVEEEELLRAAAPKVEELEVFGADGYMLKTINNMPKLKTLTVQGKGQHTELYDDVKGKKRLLANPSDIPKAEKPNIVTLSMSDLPREVTFNFISLHKETLQDLTLKVGTISAEDREARKRGNWQKKWRSPGKDVVNNLVFLTSGENCLRLKNLRLDRNDCYHDKKECKKQRNDIRRALEAKVQSRLKVTCSDQDCDVVEVNAQVRG